MRICCLKSRPGILFALIGERFLPGSSHRNWSELGELAEVLDCCCEVQLVLGAVWSSKAEAIETEPPPLNWSTAMFRKWRTENGKQATKARRDCLEVTAG